MKKNEKTVLVGISGGVDSAVAAGMLLQAGYDVTGLFFLCGHGGDLPAYGKQAGAVDAQRVADRLGIELINLDVSKDFARIIGYFVDEYSRGRTPNPCIRCNTHIKFAGLIAQADAMGIRYIATGHHARMSDGLICRAAEKDQSYALFGVPREYLGRILLPIGDLPDKSEVRRIAAELGLSVADKPDSQEICFVSGDYVDLLRARRSGALKPGDIVDSSGNVLGRHEGVANFTIGQRRGLRVAAGEPRYVTRIDPATATVTIGPKDEVMSRQLSACGANWHIDINEGWHLQAERNEVERSLWVFDGIVHPAPTTSAPLRLKVPPIEFDATVQIRYNHAGCPGRVRITGSGRFEVEFAEPIMAITPGQAAVVYDGDKLLGGGWIQAFKPAGAAGLGNP